MTFRSFLEAYILERDLAKSTEQQLRYSVYHFERFLGREIRLAEIEADDINRYLRHMQSLGRAYDTVRSRRTNLLALLNEAYRQRLTNYDSRRVRKMKTRRTAVTSWSRDEVQLAFDAAHTWVGSRKLKGGIDEGLYWTAYIAAAWDSGLRRSDLLQLTMAEITTRFWITQEKTGLPVLVEFRESTIEHIRRLHKSGPSRQRPFAWPYKRRAFFAHAKRLICQAGIGGSLKFIRRGCGTAIASQNQSVSDAARKLGHTSEAITRKHYLSPDWQKWPSLLPPPLDDFGQGE